MLKKRTRVMALFLSLSLLLPGMAQRVPAVVKAESESTVPGEKKAISSFEDLQAMEDIPGGDYYLTTDITVPENTQLFRDHPFTGTLDGKGHKIKSFRVQKKYVFSEKITHSVYGEDLFPEPAWAGLFCRAEGATFENLSLTDVDINVQTEAYATVGALVTEAGGSKFSNIHVSGKISVQSIRENSLEYSGFVVGGIAGSGGGTMTNCSNSTSISVNCKNCERAGGVSVGGLSGNGVDKITKCSNSGNISVSGYSGDGEDDDASMIVAGLVPEVGKSVTSCENSGNVSLKVQAEKGQTKYETPIRFGDTDDPPCEIEGNTVKVAGIALKVPVIESSGNTGKISLDYQLDPNPVTEPIQRLAGLVCKVGTAKRCYNKGAVSFSGNAVKDDIALIVGGLFDDCNSGKDYQLSECYNTGKVTVKAKTGGCLAGGIAGQADEKWVEIQNCYNAGDISVKAPGAVWVGGILSVYDCKYIPVHKMRYNYNVGKITGPKKRNKGAILGFYVPVAKEALGKKASIYDNYYTGSDKAYGFYDTRKESAPKAKKVSSITRAKCPKLSSKYWVYSSKLKRLILKNNKETDS